MKPFLAIALFFLAMSSAVAAPAQTATPVPSFIAPSDLALTTVLPKWPADDTLEGRADLEAVLAFQAYRSAAQEAEGDRDAALGPVEWAQSVLGSQFNAQAYPLAVALLMAVHEDMRAINRAANDVHGLRPRPAIRDQRVKPSLPNVSQADSPSYPSARTASSLVWASVLSEIFPDSRAALFAAADRTAWLRLLGGAHYPSDLAGGRIVGAAAWEALQRHPAFPARLATAQGEARERAAPAAR